MMNIAVLASNGKASRAIIEELVARGVVDVMALPSVASDARIVPSMLRAADCVLIVPARHALRIAIP